MSEVVDLLSSLIRIPSVSREEKAIADFLEDYVRAHGLEVSREGDNVLFHLGEGSPRLLLATHLDTVPPPASSAYPPFEGIQVDGRIYGRGAVDAKGCVATMTRALIELQASGYRPPGRVTVACTVGEEIGGAYNGMAMLRAAGKLPADAAIIGEPTSLTPCIAQKGLLVLEATTRGEAGHAARVADETAITRAARSILRLQSLTFEEADPLVGLPRVTVTQIHADAGGRNVVPGTCTFWIDIRSTPRYPHDRLLEMINPCIEGHVRVHSRRLVPVSTPESAPIVQACLQVLPERTPVGSPTLSDWVFLSDIPAVKIGPGDSARSHTDDEYITVEELHGGVRFYREVIPAYFDRVRSANPQP